MHEKNVKITQQRCQVISCHILQHKILIQTNWYDKQEYVHCTCNVWVVFMQSRLIIPLWPLFPLNWAAEQPLGSLHHYSPLWGSSCPDPRDFVGDWESFESLYCPPPCCLARTDCFLVVWSVARLHRQTPLPSGWVPRQPLHPTKVLPHQKWSHLPLLHRTQLKYMLKKHPKQVDKLNFFIS